MVNLVIVSHTHALAEAVKELALEMSEDVQIKTAGGVDENTVGTNAERIHDAINRAWSEDGVVVLTDLGSAIMSAEMSIEMLADDKRERVQLIEGPLITGAITAGTEASGGGDLESVARAASQEAEATGSTESSPDSTAPTDQSTQSIQLEVRNHHGLHARPAVKFAQRADEFEATVQVKNLSRDSEFVDASSMMNVVKLGIDQDDKIEISARGNNASEALEGLRHLVETELVEAEPPDQETVQPEPATSYEKPSDSSGGIKGVGVFNGVAFGPVFKMETSTPTVETRSIDDPENEWERFQSATEKVKQDLESIGNQTEQRAGTREADIFEALIAFLDDSGWKTSIKNLIEDENINAEAAVEKAVRRESQNMQDLGGSVFASRAADIDDLGNRLINHLQDRSTENPTLPDHPVIIVANDLSPAQTASLDPERVKGFCTVAGGPESHTAILARTLGIPAIVSAGREILDIPINTEIAIDGATGQVHVEPEGELREQLQDKQQSLREEYETVKKKAQGSATTKDDHQVRIFANVGDVSLTQSLNKSGAEGIGLLRTEFLFLERDSAPSEEEQLEAYRTALNSLDSDDPLTIRTLDIGGDKPAPYLELEEDLNPYLGLRGIRVSLEYPDLFKTQLRAILRAATEGTVRVMFPMVAGIEELNEAKSYLSSSIEELKDEGKEFSDKLEVGIMIEVPSAALLSDKLAEQVEFLSIGTNDLTQYTRAASRENERVAQYFDSFHPGVLKLIKKTVDNAHENGTEVAICGEMGGDPRAIPLLVGLGLDELSMVPTRIARAKEIIRSISFSRVRKLSRQALSSKIAHEVRELLEDLDLELDNDPL